MQCSWAVARGQARAARSTCLQWAVRHSKEILPRTAHARGQVVPAAKQIKGLMLTWLKYLLTVVGRKVSARRIRQAQAALNYIRTGRWVADHGFDARKRVTSKEQVWEAASRRLDNRRVLYIE